VLPPLVLRPIYRRYLWGGSRFASVFGRDLPAGEDFAESWQLVDRGDEQSVVAAGPLAGMTLGQLVREQGPALLGRHARGGLARHPGLAAFPLLFKFLDAARDLSVQVHPDDAVAARLDPPDLGKTEAWVVVDAAAGAKIYAGLRDGVDAAALAAALRGGRCDEVLHAFEPRAGDCVFIPAGTVHAIGAGLLVAEIQQSSDVTFRLFDWNRVGPDGRPRPLHVEQGLEAVTRFGPVEAAVPRATPDPAVTRLVECDYFILDRVVPAAAGDPREAGRWEVGGDEQCHFLAVLAGGLELDDCWQLPPLAAGDCVLLPAAAGREAVRAAPGTTLLRVTLP
jgi:mannose-6-phosphate isomerase